jgi:hypothetical protein
MTNRRVRGPQFGNDFGGMCRLSHRDDPDQLRQPVFVLRLPAIADAVLINVDGFGRKRRIRKWRDSPIIASRDFLRFQFDRMLSQFSAPAGNRQQPRL